MDQVISPPIHATVSVTLHVAFLPPGWCQYISACAINRLPAVIGERQATCGGTEEHDAGTNAETRAAVL